MTKDDTLLCPASSGTEGSLLFAVIQNNRRVTMLETPLSVDNAFIEVAEKSGPLEKRFRFADRCIKSNCRQWNGTTCGVIQMLFKTNTHIEIESELQPCGIREQCRWFYQDEARACSLCAFIVTVCLYEIETSHISEPGRVHEN